jgi:RNA polymerase sigma factor (sigma-70 family)
MASRAVGVRVGRMFEAHGPMVFALCRLLLRDRQEAEDALQQTFLSGYRSMLDGTVPVEPAAWLATIARNECLSRIRRRPPEFVTLRDDDLGTNEDVAEVVDRRTEIAALSEAIAGLPPAQRQAVILRDFYGLSYREVSTALGVTRPAVHSLLFRSRRLLKERLQPFHAVSGVAALPLAVRDALVRSVPGFSSGVTTPGLGVAGAGVSAKLLSTSAAAKIAALALVAGLGTVTIIDQSSLVHRHRTDADPRIAIGADFPQLSGLSGRAAETPVQLDVDLGHTGPFGRVERSARTGEALAPFAPALTRQAATGPGRVALAATGTESSPNPRSSPRPTGDELGESHGDATDVGAEPTGSAQPPVPAGVLPARQTGGSGGAGGYAPGAGPATGAPGGGVPSPSATSPPRTEGSSAGGGSSPSATSPTRTDRSFSGGGSWPSETSPSRTGGYSQPAGSGSSPFDASARPSGGLNESGGGGPGPTYGGYVGGGQRPAGGTGVDGVASRTDSGFRQTASAPVQSTSAEPSPNTPGGSGAGTSASWGSGGGGAPTDTATPTTATSSASTGPGGYSSQNPYSGGGFAGGSGSPVSGASNTSTSASSSTTSSGGSFTGYGGGPTPSGGGGTATTGTYNTTSSSGSSVSTGGSYGGGTNTSSSAGSFNGYGGGGGGGAPTANGSGSVSSTGGSYGGGTYTGGGSGGTATASSSFSGTGRP